jgi:O-acetylserine/cysteine efflux transporter
MPGVGIQLRRRGRRHAVFFTICAVASLRAGLLVLLPLLRLPPAGQWGRLVFVCLCIGALHFTTLFWAISRSHDLSSIAITQQTYIPMAVILAMVALGEKVGWRSLTAIAVAFSGVVVLSLDPLMLDN